MSTLGEVDSYFRGQCLRYRESVGCGWARRRSFPGLRGRAQNDTLGFFCCCVVDGTKLRPLLGCAEAMREPGSARDIDSAWPSPNTSELSQTRHPSSIGELLSHLEAAQAPSTGTPRIQLLIVLPVGTCHSCPSLASSVDQVVQIFETWSQPSSLACAAAAPVQMPGRAAKAARWNSHVCGPRPIQLSIGVHAMIYTDQPLSKAHQDGLRQAWGVCRAKACFEQLLFASANVTDARHPEGPNMMFRVLLAALVKHGRYDYFAFHELDVTPIRPYWLESIAALLPPNAPHFWSKGSAPRSASGFNGLHINGNALYAANDTEFADFVEAAIEQHGFNEDQRCEAVAYDVAISRHLLSSADPHYRNRVIHRFVFSDWINNDGDRDSSAPCTVLWHKLVSRTPVAKTERERALHSELVAVVALPHAGPRVMQSYFAALPPSDEITRCRLWADDTSVAEAKDEANQTAAPLCRTIPHGALFVGRDTPHRRTTWADAMNEAMYAQPQKHKNPVRWCSIVVQVRHPLDALVSAFHSDSPGLARRSAGIDRYAIEALPELVQSMLTYESKLTGHARCRCRIMRTKYELMMQDPVEWSRVLSAFLGLHKRGLYALRSEALTWRRASFRLKVERLARAEGTHGMHAWPGAHVAALRPETVRNLTLQLVQHDTIMKMYPSLARAAAL